MVNDSSKMVQKLRSVDNSRTVEGVDKAVLFTIVRDHHFYLIGVLVDVDAERRHHQVIAAAVTHRTRVQVQPDALLTTCWRRSSWRATS